MSSSTCLLILCKNPILGKAKTRLASSVGDEKALEVYRFLLEHTAKVVAGVSGDKRIFYSHSVLADDAFQGPNYHKTLQSTGDLGARMQAAFEEAFAAGYERVVIIGSDCYDLSSPVLEEALAVLQQQEAVFGPAKDGGYYLMGLNRMIPAVFTDQPWSQSNLLTSTRDTLDQLGHSYQLLSELSDVDYLEDLPLDVREKFGI
ncbi:MAG: TIGR04282 family arsenosugar biosynthesis glycosyltransferase [Aureispira sp.]